MCSECVCVFLWSMWLSCVGNLKIYVNRPCEVMALNGENTGKHVFLCFHINVKHEITKTMHVSTYMFHLVLTFTPTPLK